jgi:uncharacterized protein (DUF2147 family)
MKKLYVLAALLMATTAAHAGNSISVEINGHQIHIEVPKNCDQLSCMKISAPGLAGSDSGVDKSDRSNEKSDRFDDEQDRFNDKPDRFGGKPDRFNDKFDRFGDKSDRFNDKSDRFNDKPNRFNDRSDRFNDKPNRFNDRSDRFNDKPERFNDKPDRFNDRSDRFNDKPNRFGGRFNRNKSDRFDDDDVAARSDQPASKSPAASDAGSAATESTPTAPAATNDVAPTTPAPVAVATVAPTQADAPVETPTTPIGVWATEQNKGNVRVEPCGSNLCGYAVKTGEKILINMKASDTKWTGRIHDPNSGRDYDSTMAMKGPNAMRVQGCAFGGMFCGGQTWKRVS